MAAWLGSAAALAEGQATVHTSFSVANAYDDNVFASSSRPVGDTYVRYTPGVEFKYERGGRLSIGGGLSLDAEVYGEQSDLSSYSARRMASASLTYAPSAVSTLSFNAAHADTRRPGELVEDTGLDLGRARSEGYTSVLRFEKRVGPSDSWSLGHSAILLRFGGEESASSHALEAGWSHRIGSRTRLSLQAGPRFTDGEIDTDLAGSLTHELNRGEVYLNYASEHNPVPVEDLVVSTERLSLGAAYRIRESFRVSASPSLLRNRRGEGEADIYRLSLGASYQVNRWLVLEASHWLNVQKGSVESDAGSEETIRHSVTTLSVRVAYRNRIE